MAKHGRKPSVRLELQLWDRGGKGEWGDERDEGDERDK